MQKIQFKNPVSSGNPGILGWIVLDFRMDLESGIWNEPWTAADKTAGFVNCETVRNFTPNDIR
jgi:hypothetical protein